MSFCFIQTVSVSVSDPQKLDEEHVMISHERNQAKIFIYLKHCGVASNFGPVILFMTHTAKQPCT